MFMNFICGVMTWLTPNVAFELQKYIRQLIGFLEVYGSDPLT